VTRPILVNRIPIGFGVAFALFSADALEAQERRDSTRTDSSVVTLPALEVRGTPTPVANVGGTSGLQARLDSLRLPAATTFEQVLRQLPMLHVRRNSRGEAELSVRGSESRQVAVLVDGVPLTLAWDGRADVSVIPATAPQTIQFIRGLSSMLYGPNVLGGIVEMGVGRSFFQPPSATADLASELDHLGGVGTRGSLTLPFASANAGWLVRAGGSHRDSPGFPLARNVVEPVPTTNDVRVNTDATNVDGFLAVRYQNYGGPWFSFSGSTFTAERGIAAELGIEDGARFWRYPHVSRTFMVASGGTGDQPTPLGRGDLEASIGLDLGRVDIDSYTDRTYTTRDAFENGKDRGLALRLLGDHSIATRGDFHAAFTLSDVRHDEILPDGNARYRQRLWSVGGETTWRIIEQGAGIEWLRMSAGGAYDVAVTPESGGREPLGTISQWGGRVGATVGLRGGNTLLHGSVSRRGRFPSLRELYSGALNRFAPNPDLKPEKLLAIEAGVTTRAGAGELQVVGFRHVLHDAVVRTTLPDRRFLRVNRDRLTSLGLELLASVVIGPVALGGDVTLQSVEITDTRASVTHEPENLPGLFGSAHAGVPLPFGARAFAVARYTGRQYCIDPGTGEDSRLSAGATFGAEVARTWHLRPGGGGWFGRLDTRVAVDNLGDVALYDQCGLPQPGRLFRFQLRIF
jgi:iron complex outermembrane receptor protein